MSRPIIALLTDFGTADHYAGTMKGVVLALCPDVTLDAGNACEPNPDGKKDVVGRIVTLPADYVATGGQIASNASFLKTVILVR